MDGRLKILPNGTLWTDSAGPQHEGHYVCRANNSIGFGLSKVIYVSVNGMIYELDLVEAVCVDARMVNVGFVRRSEV